MINFKDKKLAHQISKGNEKSFNEFFDFYFPRLYRFSISRLDGDKELTQDMVQETLFSAIKSIKQYRGEASLMSWLCQINRNLISTYFRKNNIKQTVKIDDLPEIKEIFDNIQTEVNNNPDRIYENHDLQELISSTLDNLPNDYGDLLELKYLDKLSISQISDQLNMSTIAVQSKLARARDAFKTIITKILGEYTHSYLNQAEPKS